MVSNHVTADFSSPRAHARVLTLKESLGPDYLGAAGVFTWAASAPPGPPPPPPNPPRPSSLSAPPPAPPRAGFRPPRWRLCPLTAFPQFSRPRGQRLAPQ